MGQKIIPKRTLGLNIMGKKVPSHKYPPYTQLKEIICVAVVSPNPMFPYHTLEPFSPA
jgi:hypothetical protein